MAGLIEITATNGGLRNMTKEIPVYPDLQPEVSECDGYASTTGISFTFVNEACTINISAGFDGYNFNGSNGSYILVETTSGVNDGLYIISADDNTTITLTSAAVLTTESAVAAGTVTLQAVGMYKIIPNSPMSKGLIIYSEGLEAGGETGMIPCLLNGSHWAAKNGLYTAFTAVAVSSGSPHGTHYLWVETAPYVQSDGSLLFMLKPVAGAEGLWTDHRPAVGFLQLP